MWRRTGEGAAVMGVEWKAFPWSEPPRHGSGRTVGTDPKERAERLVHLSSFTQEERIPSELEVQ